MRTLLSMLALCAAAAACSGKSASPTAASAPPATPPAPSTFTLTGSVLDQQSGRPVASATVLVESGPNANRSVTTDGNGAYTLSGLASGDLAVRVTAPSYNAVATSLGLSRDQRLTVYLRPTRRTISGTVTDSTSRGVLPNVLVTIRFPASETQSTRTDAAGTYTFTNVTTDSVDVAASADRYFNASGTALSGGDARVDLVMQRFGGVAPPSPTPNPGTTPTPPAGGVVIGFGGLAGTFPYEESGFRLDPFTTWGPGAFLGNPAPSAGFQIEKGTTLTGAFTVSTRGATFRFQSIDVYSSLTTIPFTFIGTLGTTPAFSVVGEYGRTNGNFVTVTNPHAGVSIDMLTIRLKNVSPDCCNNPMAVDNIILIR